MAIIGQVLQNTLTQKWAYVETSDEDSSIFHIIGDKEFDTQEEAEQWQNQHLKNVKTVEDQEYGRRDKGYQLKNTPRALQPQITAKIVADSINPQGDRITTMMVTFPRYILAELNTHRMFSRNSASSRAIPFKKMVESVKNNPFIPIAWQKDHPGMQGTEYFIDRQSSMLEQVWLEGRDRAVQSAEELYKGIYVSEEGKDTYNINVTKQFCNRLLEPFMWHTVLITATEWENFFELRCPQYGLFHENIAMSFKSRKDLLNHVKQVESIEFKDQYDNLTEVCWLSINTGQADIHMMALAEAMWDARNESTPILLQPKEWHIPFGDQIDLDKLDKETIDPKDYKTSDLVMNLIKIATARCARVSYTVVGEEDKPADYKKDVELHNRLLQSGHFSPFEHCAKVMDDEQYYFSVKGTAKEFTKYDTPKWEDHHYGWCLNYRGFIQYRSLIN